MTWEFLNRGRMEYRETDQRYTAVEDGRLTELRFVYLRKMGSPWWGWAELLLEDCGPDSLRASEIPCWPRTNAGLSQEVLRSISERVPAYRNAYVLLADMRILSRNLYFDRRCWIVGTHPVTIAVSSKTVPSDSLERRSSRLIPQLMGRVFPTDVPGVVAFPDKQGNPDSNALKDTRERFPKFVAADDMGESVVALLQFPSGIPMAYGLLPSTRQATTRPGPMLTLYQLRQPTTIAAILETRLDPESLKAMSSSVERHPVWRPYD
jgi:hypothetical protein